METKSEKRFLTYEEQVVLLKTKKLAIPNTEYAVNALEKYSYYSLISGYKGIFKVEKNGNYKPNATFEKIWFYPKWVFRKIGKT